MSRSAPDPVVQDLFRSLTPLSSVADSNDEVDRLLTFPAAPERSLVNYNADESDLSSLSSSDEGGDTTSYPIKCGRTLRPRVVNALISTVPHGPYSPERVRSSSPVDQPSWTSKKRKRTESSNDNTHSTAREQKPKPSPYVSEESCHQCRNWPRYAFMRCTSHDGSSRLCRKLFCVSCVTKRYPGDIDFNPMSKEWKCPYCRGTCNCTKCCSKRNEKYTSTSNVKIDHDTLLRYAALMPSNSNSEKPSPRPSKSSEMTNNKFKLAKKSNPRPVRDPVKSKSRVEKARDVQPNSGPARDVESIVRGLADTAAMFEKFGCVSGEYWGVVFSSVDGRRIGVAHVGDQLPDICFLRDKEDFGSPDGPPPTKRLRVSSRISS